MQIVIEISSYDKEWITNGYYIPEEINMRISEAITNGTPLPKGHGRLIDADDAKREWQNVLDCEVEHPRYQCTIRDVLEDAPTIIEAEGSEKE